MEVKFESGPEYIKETGISYKEKYNLNEFQLKLLFMNKTDEDINCLQNSIYENGTHISNSRLKKLVAENPYNKNDVIFIHAPTGSGKTFGFLLPVISSSPINFNGRMKEVITEPTNTIGEEICSDIPKTLVEINEEISFRMVSGKDKNKYNRQFQLPEQVADNDILLTNIDIISLYVSGFYLGIYTRMKKHIPENKIKQWSDIFKRIKVFIIDEYHSYDEHSLGKIISLILISRVTGNKVKFIFSSGTKNQKFMDLLKMYNIDYYEDAITPIEDSTSSRKFRGKVKLIFTDKPMLNEQIIRDNYQQMFLFDHKLDAENFIYKLKKKHINPWEITGFKNRDISINNNDIYKNIIVATNAAELGVNINPDLLHMEPGKYYENFVQRFGRVARAGKSATVYVHISTSQIEELSAFKQEKNNLESLNIDKILEVIYLKNKLFIQKKCARHTSGFIYSICRFSGNRDLQNQIFTLKNVINPFLSIDKLETKVCNDNVLTTKEKNDFKMWVDQFFRNFGYFRGVSNNIRINLPDGKLTTDDYIYSKIHYNMKKELDGTFSIINFLDKPNNVNIEYNGLGNNPIIITNKEIYNNDEFSNKFKLNFSEFFDDCNDKEEYMRLSKILFDPYVIYPELFVPEEVVVEDDDNIFL